MLTDDRQNLILRELALRGSLSAAEFARPWNILLKCAAKSRNCWSYSRAMARLVPGLSGLLVVLTLVTLEQRVGVSQPTRRSGNTAPAATLADRRDRNARPASPHFSTNRSGACQGAEYLRDRYR